MTDAVLNVELLTSTDWWVLRAARLRALTDSPYAYTSAHQLENAWDNRHWRQLLAAGKWAVAKDRRDTIGIAGLVRSASQPPHVQGVWVAPSHRKRGVLQSLIETLADEAREMGLSALLLWVLKDNTVALDAYRKLGFIDTGEEQVIRRRGRGQAEAGQRLYEVRLRRSL
jgi:ribosomal protein S18 acetylase RimI-like enzyme